METRAALVPPSSVATNNSGQASSSYTAPSIAGTSITASVPFRDIHRKNICSTVSTSLDGDNEYLGANPSPNVFWWVSGMQQGEYHLKIMPRRVLLSTLMLLFLGVLGTVVRLAKTTPGSSTNLQLTSATKGKEMPATTAQPVLPPVRR